MTQPKVKTETFRRIQNWRIKHGRDPKTGSKRAKRRNVDPERLIVIALRHMADCTHRGDLRPLYESLADEIEASGLGKE